MATEWDKTWLDTFCPAPIQSCSQSSTALNYADRELKTLQTGLPAPTAPAPSSSSSSLLLLLLLLPPVLGPIRPGSPRPLRPLSLLGLAQVDAR